MARKRAENREGSLGFPGFVKPVFTIDSKPLGRRKRSLGLLGSVNPYSPKEGEPLRGLEQGIVRPSSSEYASPIVIVKKKDGTTRLYVDYRNRKLVKDRFPLPLIEDVLDRLQGAKVYTTLDLKNGFFHVDVNEDCKRLTSFVVPDGQFVI
ncbi:retrovirus-related Pol polyprotein from transposon 412 [Trichonephila clavipes]|nr:retrovirus-related Pol polyprotein from transposon 412 [Trichonephila clavipes]